MRSADEVKELKKRLDRLTGFITDFGNKEEYKSISDDPFANNVCDALSWILGEISTEDFKDEPYLSIVGLERVARNIEKRTGKRLEDYE